MNISGSGSQIYSQQPNVVENPQEKQKAVENQQVKQDVSSSLTGIGQKLDIKA